MKKIRWCRAAALLLSAALILPACMSSGRLSERESAAPEETEAENAAEKEETAAGEEWKEEKIDQMAQLLREDLFYYGFDEPVTLKVGYSYDSVLRWAQGEGPTDNVWTRLYEKLGIEADVLFNVDATSWIPGWRQLWPRIVIRTSCAEALRIWCSTRERERSPISRRSLRSTPRKS